MIYNHGAWLAVILLLGGYQVSGGTGGYSSIQGFSSETFYTHKSNFISSTTTTFTTTT